MEQCYLVYIFISCIVVAMLLDVGFFFINKNDELRKIKMITKRMNRRYYQ